MYRHHPKCRFQDLSQIIRLIIIGVFAILFSYNLTQAAAFLDRSFGDRGKVNFRLNGSSSDFARAAVLQPDGKIVIAGTSGLDGQAEAFRNFGLARLNADGSLDSSFGTGGLVTTDFGFQQEDIAWSVVLQPDGKIVAGGYAGAVFALARYNPNGSLDKSFNGGKVVTDFEGSNGEGIYQIQVRPDGKILALGACYCGGPSTAPWVAMARYNTDGTLDSAFGTNGKTTMRVRGLDGLPGLTLQPDGKFLVTGYSSFNIPGCIPSKGQGCGTSQSFLDRYTTQMTPDKKFGRRFGREYTRWGDFSQRLHDIVLDADGRLLVTSEGTPMRYTSSGRLETVFDQVPVPGGFMVIDKLVQRPNGTVAGCSFVGGGNGWSNVAVALFNSEGRFIGSDHQDFHTGNDGCGVILAQPDGKILIVGWAQIAQQSAYSFAALRYTDITP